MIFACGSHELLRHLEARTMKPLWLFLVWLCYVAFVFVSTHMRTPLIGTLFGKSMCVHVILAVDTKSMLVCVGTTLIYHICCCCNTYVYATII